MVKIRVKYLHIRRYKGQDLLYWYPNKQYFINGQWVDCPFKGGQVKSVDEARALYERLKEWRSGTSYSSIPEHGTVDWLITEYKKDARFTDLRPSTQQLYGYSLEELRLVFGDIPVVNITRQMAKGFYQKFSGTTVRKASQVMQVARVVFNHAKDMDIISENPFEKQRVSKAKPRRVFWTSDMIQAAQVKALEMGLPSIGLALQLGFDTGQRPADLRSLTWHNYNGRTIRLKQGKTNVWVNVPVMADLKKMLDSMDKTSPCILVCEHTGKPYNKDMLSRKMREVCEKAGITNEYQYRDLRRTTVVRLAEAGCEIPEICAITGHALREAHQILEVYLPPTSKMAENAISKLEKK